MHFPRTPEERSSHPEEGGSGPSGDTDSCLRQHLANRWQLAPLPPGWQLDWERNRLPGHRLPPRLVFIGWAKS